MSDFDKEAEREKLREKYGEEDEEKRAATEQMSELLLKGATMTNAHCTDCGDPIFRYDGQEFCPTCQKPVARDQAETEGDDEADDGHIEVADPSNDATVQFGGGDQTASETDGQQSPAGTDGQQPTADRQQSPADVQQPPATDSRQSPDGTDAQQPTADAGGAVPSADPDRTPASNTAPTAPTAGQPTARQSADASPPADAVGSELSAAESLLAQTVHRFARQAAETDDPRRARDHLAAAREAAEALDAVRF
jgi:uncharacterized Zn finger protein (UPF0148 family)